jgi:hypothetical protein
MATKDGFSPDDLFPLFLSEHAENTEQPTIGKARDRAVISSRILKTSILAVAATAIGIAILSGKIRSRSLRTLRLRGPTNRRFSLAPIRRRQQSNRSPALRICRRLQGTHRRATKLLRLLNLPIRVKPKSVSRRLKAC